MITSQNIQKFVSFSLKMILWCSSCSCYCNDDERFGLGRTYKTNLTPCIYIYIICLHGYGCMATSFMLLLLTASFSISGCPNMIMSDHSKQCEIHRSYIHIFSIILSTFDLSTFSASYSVVSVHTWGAKRLGTCMYREPHIILWFIVCKINCSLLKTRWKKHRSTLLFFARNEKI